MANDGIDAGFPLLYYRTRKDIEAYAQLPTEAKFRWLQSQMEFFFRTMPDEAKRARVRIATFTGTPAGGTDREPS